MLTKLNTKKINRIKSFGSFGKQKLDSSSIKLETQNNN